MAVAHLCDVKNGSVWLEEHGAKVGHEGALRNVLHHTSMHHTRELQR